MTVGDALCGPRVYWFSMLNPHRTVREPLSFAYSLLRETVPMAMEAAGFEPGARILRSSDPADFEAVTLALRALPDLARSRRCRSDVLSSVEDIAFWAEAAVWSIASGNTDAFESASDRVVAAVRALWATVEVLH